jgi:hypothetical protein
MSLLRVILDFLTTLAPALAAALGVWAVHFFRSNRAFLDRTLGAVVLPLCWYIGFSRAGELQASAPWQHMVHRGVSLLFYLWVGCLAIASVYLWRGVSPSAVCARCGYRHGLEPGRPCPECGDRDRISDVIGTASLTSSWPIAGIGIVCCVVPFGALASVVHWSGLPWSGSIWMTLLLGGMYLITGWAGSLVCGWLVARCSRSL